MPPGLIICPHRLKFSNISLVNGLDHIIDCSLLLRPREEIIVRVMDTPPDPSPKSEIPIAADCCQHGKTIEPDHKRVDDLRLSIGTDVIEHNDTHHEYEINQSINPMVLDIFNYGLLAFTNFLS